MVREMRQTAPRGTWREVVHVAWPLVVSMLSYTLMGLADTLMVARLGTSAVAGVGIASTGYFAIVCFGMGLLNGVRVVVAQATGAQVLTLPIYQALPVEDARRIGDIVRAHIETCGP